MAGDEEKRISNDRSIELVREIAEILGCSPDVFSNPSSSEFDQRDELLRIWATIEYEQDRQKVLSFVRMIADQAAGRQGA